MLNFQKRFYLFFVATGLVSLINIALSETTFAGTNSCYQSEIDVRTMKPFATIMDHQSEVARWQSFPRPSVGVLDLGLAYWVYKLEASRASIFRSDKAKHCYFGCIIGLATSQKVVDFVGWKKEMDDLRDCNASTFFEDADYDATSLGGKLGALDKKDCAIKCRDYFVLRRKY